MTPEETENEVSVQVKQINKTLRMHIVANLLYKRVSRLYTKLSLASPKPPDKCSVRKMCGLAKNTLGRAGIRYGKSSL